ncbi:hypothetical protein Francci3_2682 [Frankia casuarinae]|uniref:Transposase putative helix-turn-helix domain-containing protein n=1 Tax=Frankia casuarinae (strain DSM 45818 / CECT 9043 / HFP020203 / CcI3) TaxID=106370 RepID=Q2J9J8_FRACC|nr:hypothetical protein Francci3_2682 [Frankia casuarinae]
MTTLQAYRFALDPNDAHLAGLARHAGAARFVYNWGLGLGEGGARAARRRAELRPDRRRAHRGAVDAARAAAALEPGEERRCPLVERVLEGGVPRRARPACPRVEERHRLPAREAEGPAGRLSQVQEAREGP